MTVHKLTAGDGYTYLTRQVAAHDATNRGFDNLGEYYTEKGEAPGVWMGSGLGAVPDFPAQGNVTEEQMVALFGQGRHPNAEAIEAAARAAGKTPWEVDQASRLGNPYRIYAEANVFRRRSAGAFRDYNLAIGVDGNTPLPPEVRARMRTELAEQMFLEDYGRPPADARELSGHLARISRQATTAVAGYDLSFSPVKSVSTLWALAPRDVAQVIEQAHHDAVQDTVTWLENNAAFTRRGKHGVAQVDVVGLIAAAFTHRDSRAGDPDLHTHVAISNKVQALDGTWLALDGRPLFKNGVTASERYNTRLEALLIDRLGVRFADRPGADPGKRPVREIIGVDGPLPRQWSSRRAAIDIRRAVLSAQFQVDHGRPPTPQEAIALAGQANKETRQAKHEPRSYAEQRHTWRSEALAVIGGDAGLAAYLRRALHPPRDRSATRRASAEWVNLTAATVLDVVQAGRATWQVHHVRAEAERQARSAGIALADIDRAVDALVTQALSPALSIPLGATDDSVTDTYEPAALRRRNGTSVYTVAGSKLYTSTAILQAEEAILAAAARRGGRTVPPDAVELALLESAADGIELNPGQAELVRELATSGKHVQLALAPAGTGKTSAMRVLARAWTTAPADGSTPGQVVGLAPSAAAAAVLRDELGTCAAATDTLAKLLHALDTGIDVPDWVNAIGSNTLVVIDEAGMAGTTDLAKAINYVTDRGGSVRLLGDDQQLAAIGAGGALRDVATTHGAVTLSQVLRFTHPDTGAPNHAEGAASLAVRDGDPAAIAYYTDNGRVHVGDSTTVTDDAYTAWSADRAAGRDAIMLAPTRDLVTELNHRAQQDRLAQQDGPTGRRVRMADGSLVSAGDSVITRRNSRELAVTATDWVKNGDRWTVDTVRENGALDVTHLRTGRHITLPAHYVTRHVTLGYATTVHAAQGITADTNHTVATGQESRQLLYVALTRGRHSNHVYLTTAGDGDAHSVITRDALLPPTAVNILTRVLARDGSPVSATSATSAAADPVLRLRDGADQYHDALGVAAADVLGETRMAEIDTTADTILPGLSHREAYPTLRAHLAMLAVNGDHPGAVLRQALDTRRGLGDARDVAAVLDWRLDPTGHRSTDIGPLPWLPPVPDTLRENQDWGRYLARRVEVIAIAATEVASRARCWTPTSAPAWAKLVIDHDRDLVADLAVWRAANNVDDGDPRPTGQPLPTAADARAQRALNQRVTRLLGDPLTATGRWAPLADAIDQRITADPYWPTLADRLTDADRAGIDITSLMPTVGRETPLPDEQPAAALWWRLYPHLTADAITSTAAASVEDLLLPEAAPLPADAELDPSTEHESTWTPSVQAHDTTSQAGLTGHPSDAEVNAAIDEACTWDTALVARARIVDLNTQATAFFADHYSDAWAPGYVTERLGSDLTDDPRAKVGYAPSSWTALTSHLRHHGATDEEIVGAGLGSYASTGRVIDRFRDRLAFPLQATGPDGEVEIHGFIGRRNPAKSEADNAGPKYLNSADTDLFTKGHELYGLAENATALAAGATPVLVEGPMDALAVTLTGDGAYVGVAPLGTAFTEVQANALRPYIGSDRPGIIVATDSDRAGHQAAHRAFWQLTARGDNPRQLVIADGKDPAELLQTRGADALRAGLESAVSLADSVIAARTAPWADRLDTVEGRVFATRAAAQVITALPPDQWPSQLTRIVARTGIAADTALGELFDAHTTWSADPHAAARRHLVERLPDPVPNDTAAPISATSTSGPAEHTDHEPIPQTVTDRWGALAESVTPGLTEDPGWPSLAASLDRAERTGYDVRSRLPSMVADHPLPAEHVARSVEFRLAEAWPGSIAARNRTTIRPSQPNALPPPIYPAVLSCRPADLSTTRLSPRK